MLNKNAPLRIIPFSWRKINSRRTYKSYLHGLSAAIMLELKSKSFRLTVKLMNDCRVPSFWYCLRWIIQNGYNMDGSNGHIPPMQHIKLEKNFVLRCRYNWHLNWIIWFEFIIYFDIKKSGKYSGLVQLKSSIYGSEFYLHLI